MVSFRPLSRVIPLTNGLCMAYKWGLLTTYKSWDDPPSIAPATHLFSATSTGPLFTRITIGSGPTLQIWVILIFLFVVFHQSLNVFIWCKRTRGPTTWWMGSQWMVQWLITSVIVFIPKTWGCSRTPSKWRSLSLINGGDPITTYLVGAQPSPDECSSPLSTAQLLTESRPLPSEIVGLMAETSHPHNRIVRRIPFLGAYRAYLRGYIHQDPILQVPDWVTPRDKHRPQVMSRKKL